MTKKYLKPPFGAVVETWGTSEDTSSSGMLHYWDVRLFGGNVGHAAVELRLPLDQMDLVKKYCDKSFIASLGSQDRPAIPYEVKNDRVTGVDYIAVRFSWWPSSAAYSLSDIASDRKDEHLGHDASKDSRLKDLPLQEVYVKGRLGGRKIKIAPVGMVDKIEEEPEITELLALHVQLEEALNKISQLETLKNKYSSSNLQDGVMKASRESKSYIRNLLGSDVPREILTKSEFNAEDCNVLRKLAAEKIDEAEKLCSDLETQIPEKEKQICMNRSGVTDIDEVNSRLWKLEIIVTTKSWGAKLFGGYEFVSASHKASIAELQALREQKSRYDAMQQALSDKKHEHLRMWQIEDASVRLPVGEDGMDVEAMLKEMRNIADNEKFHIKYMNCSVVTSRILAAGAPSAPLKTMAAQNAWGFFANPQKIYNAAVFIRESLAYGHSITAEVATSDFLGINKLVGFVIEKYVTAMKKDEAEHAKLKISAEDSHKKITRNKIEAVLIGIPILPVVSFLYVLKHLLRPTIFIKDCISLLRWVFATEATLLKTVMAIALIPAIIVHLIPALFETVVFGVFSTLHKIGIGIANLFKTKSVDDSDETVSLSAEASESDLDQSLFDEEELRMAAAELTPPVSPIDEEIAVVGAGAVRLTSDTLSYYLRSKTSRRTSISDLSSYFDSLSSTGETETATASVDLFETTSDSRAALEFGSEDGSDAASDIGSEHESEFGSEVEYDTTTDVSEDFEEDAGPSWSSLIVDILCPGLRP